MQKYPTSILGQKDKMVVHLVGFMEQKNMCGVVYLLQHCMRRFS